MLSWVPFKRIFQSGYVQLVFNKSKMNGIPIIDFAKVSESSEEISKEIKSALANVGFLYIVNHGVDMSKVNNITNRCRVFVI